MQMDLISVPFSLSSRLDNFSLLFIMQFVQSEPSLVPELLNYNQFGRDLPSTCEGAVVMLFAHVICNLHGLLYMRSTCKFQHLGQDTLRPRFVNRYRFIR